MTKGTAVITGTASGIGAVYANRIAARDFHLFVAARNSARLEAPTQHLRDRHNVAVEVVRTGLRFNLSRSRAAARYRATISPPQMARS